MRLIKLSQKIFDTEAKVGHYFNGPDSEFRSRNTKCGVFIFPKGWIAEDGINPNETVLFSYKGSVVCVAKTLSNAFHGMEQNVSIIRIAFKSIYPE